MLQQQWMQQVQSHGEPLRIAAAWERLTLLQPSLNNITSWVHLAFLRSSECPRTFQWSISCPRRRWMCRRLLTPNRQSNTWALIKIKEKQLLFALLRNKLYNECTEHVYILSGTLILSNRVKFFLLFKSVSDIKQPSTVYLWKWQGIFIHVYMLCKRFTKLSLTLGGQ